MHWLSARCSYLYPKTHSIKFCLLEYIFSCQHLFLINKIYYILFFSWIKIFSFFDTFDCVFSNIWYKIFHINLIETKIMWRHNNIRYDKWLFKNISIPPLAFGEIRCSYCICVQLLSKNNVFNLMRHWAKNCSSLLIIYRDIKLIAIISFSKRSNGALFWQILYVNYMSFTECN
jgi:hypothetical protein